MKEEDIRKVIQALKRCPVKTWHDIGDEDATEKDIEDIQVKFVQDTIGFFKEDSKVFIIQKYQKSGTSWLGTETYTYKETLSKAFKSRQDAHKYLEGTIGAVRESNRWLNKTCYNSYLYEVKQVNID